MTGQLTPPTRRRVVRRAVMVVAACVLLPIGYVGSAAMLIYADEANWVPRNVRPLVEAYQTPLIFYCDHEWPGHEWIFTLMVKSMEAGYESTYE